MSRSLKSLPSLDSYKNNRNNFCGCWTLRGQMKVNNIDIIRYSRLPCKRWTCPDCGIKRVRMLKHAITKIALEKNLNRFLTLTLDHKTCTPEESLMYIRNCWNKFRTYLKRKHGQSITFFAIVEPQKSGHAHLHILVDRYIDQRWISNKWRSVGGGRMVFIKQVDIHRISNYLSKYLTKELLLSHFFSKYRRYTTSRDIKMFPKQSNGTWELIKRPLNSFVKAVGVECSDSHVNKDGEMEWFTIMDNKIL